MKEPTENHERWFGMEDEFVSENVSLNRLLAVSAEILSRQLNVVIWGSELERTRIGECRLGAGIAVLGFLFSLRGINNLLGIIWGLGKHRGVWAELALEDEEVKDIECP